MEYIENHWSFVAYSSIQNFSAEEAIATAAKYGLQNEVQYLINHGYSPNEALAEWDIL